MMDKKALDRYLTTEPDNGYQNWLEKVWDKIPESEISIEEYDKYERFFNDLSEKLGNSVSEDNHPTIEISSAAFIRRFNALKENIANIKNQITLEPEIMTIIKKLNDSGNTALLVGGCVRDAYLGIKPKDIDIEVYGISYAELESFLSQYGSVDIVGKSFGVIVFNPTRKVLVGSAMKYDFSIPRTESKSGVGHKGFEVSLRSDITIQEAAMRRDVTFNALAYDVIKDELYDYYGGVGDMENKIIRHTSDLFEDDYLRILRLFQMQSRLGFDIHETTIYKIKNMLKVKEGNEFTLLPKERVYEEWMKWAEKGVRHDLIFKFMRETGLIEYYPELKALKNTPQDDIYHPEGNVEIHSTLCLREIDRIVAKNYIVGRDKAILVMAVLLHDLAKPNCTKEEMKRGRLSITSNGHEELGGVMSRELLTEMGFHADIIELISNLIANHLAGVQLENISVSSGKVKFVKKLSRKLHPATIHQLLFLMDADTNGRNECEHDWNKRKVPTGAKEMIEIASQVKVVEKQYEYILMGRHLIELGIKPSPEFGNILKKANEAQENGEFNDVEGGIKWLRNYLSI